MLIVLQGGRQAGKTQRRSRVESLFRHPAIDALRERAEAGDEEAKQKLDALITRAWGEQSA